MSLELLYFNFISDDKTSSETVNGLHMLRREVEGRQSLPTLHYRSAMREQEHHLNGLQLNALSLPRRQSNLATGSSTRAEKAGRNSRSNSISSSSSLPLQMPSNRPIDLSRRRSSISKSTIKERKDSSSSSSSEQYSFVVLGVGGVGKTGKVLLC